MPTVKPKSLKATRNETYAVKPSYECKRCLCLGCNFTGECHCPMKDPDFKATKDGVLDCDNYMEVTQ